MQVYDKGRPIAASGSTKRLYMEPTYAVNQQYQRIQGPRTYSAYRYEDPMPQQAQIAQYHQTPEYMLQQPIQVTQTFISRQDSSMPLSNQKVFSPSITVTPPTATKIESSRQEMRMAEESSSRRTFRENDYWKTQYARLYEAYTHLQRQREHEESDSIRQLKTELQQLRRENTSLREQLQWSSAMESYFLDHVQQHLADRIDSCRSQTMLECEALFNQVREQHHQQPSSRRRY